MMIQSQNIDGWNDNNCDDLMIEKINKMSLGNLRTQKSPADPEQATTDILKKTSNNNNKMFILKNKRIKSNNTRALAKTHSNIKKNRLDHQISIKSTSGCGPDLILKINKWTQHLEDKINELKVEKT